MKTPLVWRLADSQEIHRSLTKKKILNVISGETLPAWTERNRDGWNGERMKPRQSWIQRPGLSGPLVSRRWAAPGAELQGCPCRRRVQPLIIVLRPKAWWNWTCCVVGCFKSVTSLFFPFQYLPFRMEMSILCKSFVFWFQGFIGGVEFCLWIKPIIQLSHLF